jgi:hypothetical protein
VTIVAVQVGGGWQRTISVAPVNQAQIDDSVRSNGESSQSTSEGITWGCNDLFSQGETCDGDGVSSLGPLHESQRLTSRGPRSGLPGLWIPASEE